MKNKMRLSSNRGITMVVLIITIVISLILVGISINMVRQNEGVVEKARKAGDLSQTKEEREKVDEAWVKYQAYDSDTMSFKDYLQQNNYEWELDDGEGDYEGYYIVTIENGNQYEIKKEKSKPESDAIDICLHEFEGDWTTIQEATCVEDGIISNVCKKCGEIITTKVSKTGHQLGERKVIVEPACNNEGQSAKECSVCHQYFETKLLSKTDHRYGRWKIDRTNTEKMYRKCKNCGNIERKKLNVSEWLAGDFYVYSPKAKIKIFTFQDNNVALAYNIAGNQTITLTYQIDFENRQLIVDIPVYMQQEFERMKSDSNYDSSYVGLDEGKYPGLLGLLWTYDSNDKKSRLSVELIEIEDEDFAVFTDFLEAAFPVTQQGLDNYFFKDVLGRYVDIENSNNFIKLNEEEFQYAIEGVGSGTSNTWAVYKWKIYTFFNTADITVSNDGNYIYYTKNNNTITFQKK